MKKEPSFLQALLPIFVLITLLAINIFEKGGEWFGDYSNHYILLFSGFIALVFGILNKVRLQKIWAEVKENLKSILIPVVILLLVGALSGSWLVSGIIPTMVYYGLQVLSPEYFLISSVVISTLISLITGSSWTTTATVGVALISVGMAMDISVGMIAGAVISGAYFGDKMSPLSDTTNLAPAMAGTDLYTHIKYMSFTTIPSYVITLIFFAVISLFMSHSGTADVSELLTTIQSDFTVSPYLFLIPLAVVILVVLKVKPILALGIGVLIASVVAYFYQENLILSLGDSKVAKVFEFIFYDTSIQTDNLKLERLYSSNGFEGMLGTIYLIISAMIFGGIMDGVGYLSKITNVLLKMAKSTFGLFGSTVLSCLGLNAVASDQYLAIVIPGKMFKKAYQEKGLAPENLSRTLEDSGTVTSVLIPWNTCGAYQSKTLGVGVEEYFAFAIFNWISPIVTLFFAYFRIKIRRLKS